MERYKIGIAFTMYTGVLVRTIIAPNKGKAIRAYRKQFGGKDPRKIVRGGTVYVTENCVLDSESNRSQ